VLVEVYVREEAAGAVQLWLGVVAQQRGEVAVVVRLCFAR